MTNDGNPAPTVLITGATDGIGHETARELIRRGANVVVHGRNPDKVKQTVRELGTERPEASVRGVTFDLADFSQIREASGELVKGPPIHVILNNAGVYMTEPERSADGFEMTFAVNHLAPFLLTHLLLAGPGSDAIRRVVNVSSVAHGRGRIDLEDLNFDRRGFDGYSTYAASKLANVLFTVELARRLASRQVTVNALHPGVVSTKLLTAGFGMQGPDSLQKGASTSVKLCLDAEFARTTGEYLSGGRIASPNPVVKDAALCRRFYEKSAELCGVDML